LFEREEITILLIASPPKTKSRGHQPRKAEDSPKGFHSQI